MRRFRRRGRPKRHGDQQESPDETGSLERRGRRRGKSRGDREEGRRRPVPIWEGALAVSWRSLVDSLSRRKDLDLTVWQLLDELGLEEEAADGLRDQVAFLERLGLLHHHRRGRIRLHARERLASGTLSIPTRSRSIGRHWGASGAFGFVRTGDADGDLYVPARGLSGARHGDLVLCRRIPARRTGRVQGEILAVLRPAPTRYAGQIEREGTRLTVRPRDDRFAEPLPVDGGKGMGPSVDSAGSPAAVTERPELHEGDLVLAEAPREGPRRARVVEVLGPATEIRSAEEMVIRDLGLPGEFPREAQEEAARLPDSVSGDEAEDRTDFRARTVITIDPATARDFDDAIGAEPLEGGELRLWVHIADVAAYVPEGSALDVEAEARGCSVYLPGRVIPMLPEQLSSGIASLKPGVDRLVQSVAIDFDQDARVKSVDFADGVIRSAGRLTYEEAAERMARGHQAEAGDPIDGLLHLVAPLAERLTRNRIARGALDLDLPELEFERGLEGDVISLQSRARTPAHRMIEEFMLAANEAVARALAGGPTPAIYRIHDEPDPREIEKVEESLRELIPAIDGKGPAPRRLHRILRQVEDRPEAAIVAKTVLKAMKLACYADGPGLHFGLALRTYTHFTSPIRRYPDLVVHRALRSWRRGGERSHADRPDGRSLAEIAADASKLERRATDAERAMNDLQIAHHLGDRTGESFEGRVSGRSRGGIFVAFDGPGLPAGLAEGFALAERPAGYLLTEPVRVRLESVDLLRGKLRLALVEG